MNKFKSDIQLDSMDCGITCLKMVAQYYKKKVNLDFLRNICFASKKGVTLLSISEAAEQIGFKSIGGRITIEKLKKEAPLPCIIHWNQEHFVVVYKIREKTFSENKPKFTSPILHVA